MKKICPFLIIFIVPVLFLFADDFAISNTDLVYLPDIPAEFMETADGQTEFVSDTDTPTDILPVKPVRVPKGKFNLGVSGGMNIHNGTYKNLNGRDLELKTNFVSFKVNASYKLNSPVVIYGNVTFGFPRWMEFDGVTHDSDKHWDNTSASDCDLSSRNFRSLDIGVAYIFRLKGLDVLAGGGIHHETLAWGEEHLRNNGGTKVRQRREYTFQSWGVNLHLEGRMEMSDTWLLTAVVAPSFSISNNYEQIHYNNDVEYSADSGNKDGGKTNCDLSISIGAMYRF